MTDTTHIETSADPVVPEELQANAEATDRHVANMLTLEILFLGFVGLAVVVFFIDALGYAIVSSRTPFVIMVPLFILIAVQARRLWALRGRADFGSRVGLGLKGGNAKLNKTVGFSAWMVALLATIMVLGHYIGIFGFCAVLMRRVAREPLKLTLIVAGAVTAAVFVIFEIGFNVELYRGLLFRYFMGYRDF